VLIFLPQATEPAGGYTIEYVAHDQCDTTYMVTFPATPRLVPVFIFHSAEPKQVSNRIIQCLLSSDFFAKNEQEVISYLSIG